jgi:hypothetical protein
VSRKDGNAELRRKFERNLMPALGTKPVRELRIYSLFCGTSAGRLSEPGPRNPY